LLKVAGVTVETRAFENIPQGQPVVYVSNHQSFFDILALLHVLPDPFRFVAKKELAKIPVFGRSLKAAGHIYIDRQRRQAAFESYEKAAAVIRGGMSAAVFAEGTRSRTGDLLPFKKGPFVLAIAAQVPVIPVYCANTFHILPKGHFRIRPRPVTLYFGEPIPTAGMDYEDRTRLLNQARSVVEGFRDDALRRSPQVEGR
jgi:1-acyl-sn-glycerol-3-phosphate acyltransferase